MSVIQCTQHSSFTPSALMLPNWVVGPSYLVAFGILFALRIGAEERMMLEEFGDEYVAESSLMAGH